MGGTAVSGGDGRGCAGGGGQRMGGQGVGSSLAGMLATGGEWWHRHSQPYLSQPQGIYKI